jgi:hypothetical protein
VHQAQQEQQDPLDRREIRINRKIGRQVRQEKLDQQGSGIRANRLNRSNGISGPTGMTGQQERSDQQERQVEQVLQEVVELAQPDQRVHLEPQE